MKTLIFAVLCALSLPAAATDLDYSYVDLAYTRPSYDFTTGSSNGYQLDVSWDLGRSGFALEGAYTHSSLGHFTDATFASGKPESYRLGGAYHMAAGEFLDFVAHADYVSAKTTLHIAPFNTDTSESDTGYVLGLGLRGKVSDAFELDAFVDHDNTGLMQHGTVSCPTGVGCLINWAQDGSETAVSVAGRYRFTGPFGLGLEYRHSSLQGGNEWLLSGRWNF